MQLKSLIRYAGFGLLAFIVLYIAGYFLILDFIVEYWWFDSMDYPGYFWQRFLYKFAMSAVVTLLFFLTFFINFWFASRYLGTEQEGMDVETQSFMQKLRNGAMGAYTPLSLILAIIVAIPFYRQWEAALLFIFAPNAHVSDAVYANDISFYLFSLPVFQLIQKELLITSIILFIGVAFLYMLEERVVEQRNKHLPTGSKIHRVVLIGFVCGVVVWGFLLQRFNLLYTGAHEPLFFGPGYVEMNYQLPLIWIGAILFIVAAYAAILLVLSHGKQGRKVLVTALALLLLSFALRGMQWVPNAIEDYIVKANQLSLERPYIKNNIKATLHAYKLDAVTTVDVPVALRDYDELAKGLTEDFNHNIPLWDKSFLKDVYNQLQGITPFYNFPSVDEDRYRLGDTLYQVNIGAREINLNKLPKESRTWQNVHLKYTHGYGAAMNPAAQIADRPIEWYLRDLNMQSAAGIKVQQPDIYYGNGKYEYAIVPNDLDIAGIAGTAGKDPKKHDHLGEGGIRIGSVWRKILFSVYFGDPLIFLSADLSPDSKMRFRRNITQRVQALVPELMLDHDPYLVAGRKNLYWIQDAYTTSEYYPASKSIISHISTAEGFERKVFNYIRNSVKITVNAYDGTVRFYVADPTDPIIIGYKRAYPGVFKDINDMPEELKPHLRYPEDIFKHQTHVYARYHQTDPNVFYEQAESWSLARIGDKELSPYYLTTNLELPGCTGEAHFMQIGVMTRVNRANLSALLIGGALDTQTCQANAAKQELVALSLPKELQVNGPAQIAALINQDPEISGQFTLWGQGGSTVELGHMIVLPVGKTMLYIQPVYLLAEKDAIPQLARVIVSASDEVIMDASLEKAFKRLLQKLKIDRAGLMGQTLG